MAAEELATGQPVVQSIGQFLIALPMAERTCLFNNKAAPVGRSFFRRTTVTQNQLNLAVSNALGEEVSEIRRRGFSLIDPFDADFDYECDQQPPQVIDWDGPSGASQSVDEVFDLTNDDQLLYQTIFEQLQDDGLLV